MPIVIVFLVFPLFALGYGQVEFVKKDPLPIPGRRIGGGTRYEAPPPTWHPSLADSMLESPLEKRHC